MMRKFKMIWMLFLIGFGTTVFVGALKRSCWAESSEVVGAPWEVSYHDGSGNAYRFWRGSAAAEARYFYSPTKPQDSSSGVYSGGEEKRGSLDDATVAELWRRVRQLESDSSLHVTARMMGTGAFRLNSPAGTREFIVKDCPTLQAFNQFLAQLPGATTAFPIYPGATRDPGQGGATSIQPGKNYRLSVYTSASPLEEVLRFYQGQLKDYQQKEDPDGSIKLTTGAGSVHLTKSGPQTHIQIVQGPE